MEKSRLDLVLRMPFWGRLALTLPVRVCADIPTACTNGKEIRYNGQWFAGLGRAERAGVHAHEIAHCAYLHCTRRGTRDPKLWNIATDMEINQGLKGAGFALPKGAIFPDSTGFANGLCAEKYYDLLTQGQNGGETGNPGQSQGQGGQNGPSGEPSPDLDPGGCGGVEDCPAGASAQTSGDWTQKVIGAIQAEEMSGRGDCPGGLKGFIADLLKPRVDWRTVLRDFLDQSIPSDYSYRRPSRRGLAQGVILPGCQYDPSGKVVIALDTSGSVSDKLLAQFWGECRGILAAHKVTADIVLCDAEVQEVQQDISADDELTFGATGRGGTSFRPVFQWITDNGESPRCLIYLTDLEGDFPDTEPDYPVLWVTPELRRPAWNPWGEQITIDQEG